MRNYYYICTQIKNNNSDMAIDKVAYWLDIAEEDLGVAEDLYKAKRWLYVAFMCHQAIEKTLKAYWNAVREDEPPYTHNHKRLADGCGLYSQLTEEQKDFLNTITNYNIEARYPEDKDALYNTLTPQACQELIEETKQLTQWIKEKL